MIPFINEVFGRNYSESNEIIRFNSEHEGHKGTVVDDSVFRLGDKIYHIEATTASIFYVVKSKPEREKEIQSFMEYYLPATLKLLGRYAELEKQNNHSSESIRNSMLNIEGAMDKVVEGFDTQLDKLYKSDAIDITNDINVLEKMMRMEGLNGK